MNLDAIHAALLDHRQKGIPGGTAPFRLDAIAAKGWNILREDMNFPVAVLKDSVLTHNSAWMRDFLARSRAVIAPHGKTTMAPQLFQRQLDDGAWAITLATPQQVQVARDFGVRRIVLANQLISRRAIDWVLGELQRDPGFAGPLGMRRIGPVADEVAWIVLGGRHRAGSVPWQQRRLEGVSRAANDSLDRCGIPIPGAKRFNRKLDGLRQH